MSDYIGATRCTVAPIVKVDTISSPTASAIVASPIAVMIPAITTVMIPASPYLVAYLSSKVE